MNTHNKIESLKRWLASLCRHVDAEKFLHFIDPHKTCDLEVHLYTKRTSYVILAAARRGDTHSFLGCIDEGTQESLVRGRLNRKTFNDVLVAIADSERPRRERKAAAIVEYELVSIAEHEGAPDLMAAGVVET